MDDAIAMELKQIGSRIRAARQDQGLSQQELAVAAHISLPHVSEIELGKSKMNILTFRQIIEALQVSADSILRSDIPEVKNIYKKEFSELFDDCSPQELDVLINLVKTVKQNMRQSQDDQ